MGTPLVIIYLAATIGSVGGGWLSSMLIKKGWSETKARLTCMLGFAFSVTPVMLISQVADFWIVVAILCLAVSAHQAWSANLFATVADKFENKVISRVVGIGTMAGTLGGTLFPLLVGYILDYYKSINQLSGGYTVIFYMAGFAYLIAWLLLRYFVKQRN